jgi:alcohol-forming fatty acyl-CoA reductase
MDAARIIGYFKSKSILITGSTGFLGKSILFVSSQSLVALKVVARWFIYKQNAHRSVMCLQIIALAFSDEISSMHAVLVEKILRVQPDVNKIYLLVRSIDEPSAKHRVQQEVS